MKGNRPAAATPGTVSYVERLGLQADPLPETGAPPAYFEDAEVAQRLNLLQHLLQSSALTLVVEGPRGSGKSTLLAQLMGRLDERWYVCRVDAARGLGSGDLLAVLARCCDLPPDCGEPALRALLAEHAARLSQHARVALILADDAHGLTDEALGRLLELGDGEGTDAPGWHLVLFGESGLGQRVAQTAARFDRHTQVHTLSPVTLSESQVTAYLEQRFRAVGGRTLPFDREQIRELHRRSNGLPGELDALARKALIETQPMGTASNPPSETAAVARPVWRRPVPVALGLLALVGLSMAVYFQDSINAWFQPSTPNPPAVAEPAEKGVADRPVVEPDRPAVREPLALPEPEPHTAQSAPRAENRQAPATPGPLWAARPQDRSPQRSAALEPPSAPVTTEARPAPQPEPEATAGDDGDAAPGAAPGTATGRERSTPAQPPSGKDVGTPATEAAAVEGVSGVDWVLAQDPQTFTIQVLASIHRETIRKAVRAHGLAERAAVYPIRYRGQDWLVLVYGRFSSRGAATEAAERLPPALRQSQPWVRPFGDVQAEVRAGRK